MTEVGDYTQHSLEGYYKQDHMLKVFWDSFRDLAEAHCLNAGCGKAHTLVDCENWWGFDFNPLLMNLWRSLGVEARCAVHDARALPYENHAFEYTVSCDFLEHIKVEDLHRVAVELRRVAPHGRHVIDQALVSSWKDTAGRTLHPSAGVTELEWEEHFGGICRPHEKRGFLLLEY